MGGLSQYAAKLTFLVLLTIITMIMLGTQLHYEANHTPVSVNYSSLHIASHNSTAENFEEHYEKYNSYYSFYSALSWSVWLL